VENPLFSEQLSALVFLFSLFSFFFSDERDFVIPQLAVDVVSPAANARQINSQKETARRAQKKTGSTKGQQKMKTKCRILLKKKINENIGGKPRPRLGHKKY